MKDYNCEILNHPEKANLVADALSRKAITALFLKPIVETEIKSAQTQDPYLEKMQQRHKPVQT